MRGERGEQIRSRTRASAGPEVGRGRHRYARLPLGGVVAAQDGREKENHPLAMARAPSRTGKPPPDTDQPPSRAPKRLAACCAAAMP